LIIHLLCMKVAKTPLGANPVRICPSGDGCVMILCKKEEWATFLSKDYSRQPVRRESQHPVLIEFVITPPPFFFSAVSHGMNFTLSRDDMIIAPVGNFVNQPVVYVGDWLGCYVRRPFPFFLWRNRPKKEPKKGRFYGALPHTPPPFEKGGRKLSSCGGDPLGWRRAKTFVRGVVVKKD